MVVGDFISIVRSGHKLFVAARPPCQNWVLSNHKWRASPSLISRNNQSKNQLFHRKFASFLLFHIILCKLLV